MSRILIDIPEVIETSRLKLIMPCAGLGAKIYPAIMDGYEDYVQWLCWPTTPPTQEAVEEEARKNHAEFILRDFIRYIIIDKESSDVVGRCALPSNQRNWSIPQFAISYFIRRSARARGYASEAAHALALMAFRDLKAKKLEIYCDVENPASNRVPQKIGFKLEYTQRGGWPRPDGELALLHTYSAFSEAQLINSSFN
jgi:RimJ/RimL family protein N-acetyltransferase